MKKLICVVLAVLIFLFLSVNTFGASFKDSEESNFINDIEELYAMGIISGDENGYFKPQECLTRAEFAKIIYTIDGINLTLGANSESSFYDLQSDHWAVGYIYYATGRKYMKGYPDGSFKPDECITGTEALKVLVSLAGYDFLAEAKGGYPSGYQSVAYEIGLLKGLDINLSDYIYREETAKMVNNALDVYIAEENTFGERYSYNISGTETVLNKKLKMRRGKGLVSATASASVGVAELACDGCIAIDGVEINIPDNEITEYLGYTVRYIYSFDDDDEENNNLVYIRDDGTKKIIVSERNDIILEGNTVRYTLDDKDKEISISRKASVIVNGSNAAFSEDVFNDMKLGEATFISSSGSGGYDIIVIKSYNVMRVGIIDGAKETLIDKYDNTKTLCFGDDTKTYTIINDEGQYIDFSQIKYGDVLAYTEGESVVNVYLSDKTANGNVDYIGDDNEFSMDGGLPLIRNYYSLENNRIEAGENLIVYYDWFGSVADVTMTADDGKVIAYLVKIKDNSNAAERKLNAKLFEQDGTFSILQFADNVRINGNTIKGVTEENLLEKIAKDGVYHQVITYEKNSEGKISAFDTARTPDELKAANEDGLCAKYESKERTYGGSSKAFNFEIYITSSTPVMIIPQDIDNAEDKEFKIANTGIYSDDKEYTVEGYTHSYKQVPASLLISRQSMATSSFEGHDCIGAVYSVSKVVAENGEEAIKIKMYKGKYGGGETAEVISKLSDELVDSNYSITDIKKGDVIKYIADGNGMLTKFQTYYKYDLGQWHGSSGGNFATLNRIFQRVVTDVDGEYVFLEEPDNPSVTETHRLDALNIVTVQKVGDNVVVNQGTASDVLPGDRGILQTISRASQILILFK